MSLQGQTGDITTNGTVISVCCVDCSEDNDDCPKQSDCASCLGSERTCNWNGDHCSAFCVYSEFCWSQTLDDNKNGDETGECPELLILRLHIVGVSMEELEANQNLINHAIAESLDITENLIKDYFVTDTPGSNKVETKKGISLPPNDNGKIQTMLEETSFKKRLNTELLSAFEDIPAIQGRIEVWDVEIGGMDGQTEDSGTLHPLFEEML